MEEGRFHCRVLQAVVVEILNQVGFERASKQSLQVIVDLTMNQLNRQLLSIKRSLSETELGEAYNTAGLEKKPLDEELVETLLQTIVEESAGSESSYRREELVSFLQYQLNITKQIKKEVSPKEESLLEILRVGDQIKPILHEDRGIIDFTGEEEGEKKAPVEKKYLDQDVQDHLRERASIPYEKPKSRNRRAENPAEDEEEDVRLEDPLIEVNAEKKEYLIRSNMRDYEHMLNKKRLTTQHCTPCDTQDEIPFLEDILSLSTLRKISKKPKPPREKKNTKDARNEEVPV
ncbi:hypothetical protein NEMIN01_2146 [Nematocida minor]|uniref:uncharacterized protein n=1 Tax=Nematocida minor TaxID=1912983 RepID=UPI0022207A19|nr:uncharacterized protein NEMIN01_2146 [Nematocida minor]KAI5192679.1 hypothetical protein NEMIN01_2146 [Nematocida minor]